METFLLSSESIKGVWAIAGTIIAAILTWIGWSIKEKVAEKKANKKFRENSEKEDQHINNKLNELIRLHIKSNEVTKSRLDTISEGLILALECNEITFKAFHQTGLLNGDSELESNKLKAYNKKLTTIALNNQKEASETIDDVKDLLEEEEKIKKTQLEEEQS